MESKTYIAFERLNTILNTLRQECPWDKSQTMKSLRYLTIEEVHELSEAIIAEDTDNLKKELGDLAMHILFYCKLAEEQGLFTTEDVYNTICDKLIARHPFIYDKDNYNGENWEQLKLKERGHREVLDGVPNTLPSLIKAQRMLEKVSGIQQVKHSNESSFELSEKMSEEEFGDMLFKLVDWARCHNINADSALCMANNKFRQTYSNSER